MNKKVFFMLFLLLSFFFSKASYLFFLKPIQIYSDNKVKCDIVIVLGGRDAYDRILKGLEVSKRDKSKLLIFSGVNEEIKNIVCYFDIKNILIESKSKNTYENAIFTKKILDEIIKRENNFICLVTSESHMFRAKKVFEKLDIKTYPIVSNLNNLKLGLLDFFPDLKYFNLNISILYEYLALLKYKLYGRI